MKHVLNTVLIRQQQGYCALSFAIPVKGLHAALSYRKKSLQKNQRCCTVFVRTTRLKHRVLSCRCWAFTRKSQPRRAVKINSVLRETLQSAFFFPPQISYCPNPICCSLHLVQQGMLAVTGIAKY